MSKCDKFTFFGKIVGFIIGAAIITTVLYFAWPAITGAAATILATTAAEVAAAQAGQVIITGLTVAISMTIINLTTLEGGNTMNYLCNKRKTGNYIRAIIGNSNDDSFLKTLLFLSNDNIQEQLSEEGIFETFTFDNQTLNLWVPVFNHPVNFTYNNIDYEINRRENGAIEVSFNKYDMSIPEFDSMIKDYSANEIYNALHIDQYGANIELYQNIIHVINQQDDFNPTNSKEVYYYGKKLKEPIDNSNHVSDMSIRIGEENIPVKVKFEGGNVSILYQAKYAQHISISKISKSLEDRVPSGMLLGPDELDLLQNMGYNIQGLSFPFDFKIGEQDCYLVKSNNHDYYLYGKNLNELKEIKSSIETIKLDKRFKNLVHENLNTGGESKGSLNELNLEEKAVSRQDLLEFKRLKDVMELIDPNNEEEVLKNLGNNIMLQMKCAEYLNKKYREYMNDPDEDDESDLEHKTRLINFNKKLHSKICQNHRNSVDEDLKRFVDHITDSPANDINGFVRYNEFFVKKAEGCLQQMTETFS